MQFDNYLNQAQIVKCSVSLKFLTKEIKPFYMNRLGIFHFVLKVLLYSATASSKIIRVTEIICFKISYLMQFYELNFYQVMTFRLYIVYNKHEMIKIGNETRVKSQVLSQELDADCNYFSKDSLFCIPIRSALCLLGIVRV